MEAMEFPRVPSIPPWKLTPKVILHILGTLGATWDTWLRTPKFYFMSVMLNSIGSNQAQVFWKLNSQ